MKHNQLYYRFTMTDSKGIYDRYSFAPSIKIKKRIFSGRWPEKVKTLPKIKQHLQMWLTLVAVAQEVEQAIH